MQRWVLRAALVAVPSMAAFVVAALALGRTEPDHMPLHIGCTHHNHGPKWHADHGRILGAVRGSAAQSRPPGADELRTRSLTAGRTGSRAEDATFD